MPAIVGLFGLLMIHHPMLLSGLARIQADGDDVRLINYLLEHSYRWIAGYPAHREYWNIPFFYPAPNVAAYSDTLLSVAPFYWLWRVVGLLPDTAFQLWTLCASIANYLCGYWLLKSGFHRGTLGSSCGAFLFAFAAPRINELIHPQLVPQVYTVVTLVAILYIFRGPPRLQSRSLLLWLVAGLSLAAQFYAAFYLGWFLVFALGLAGCWALVLPRCRPAMIAVIRHQWPAIAGAAVAASLAVYPLFVHYLQTSKQVGMRSDFAIMLSLAYWESWVYEGPDSWIWGWLPKLRAFQFLGLESAQRKGFGLVTPAVCAAGLFYRWREPVVRLLALTMLTLVIAVTRFDHEICEGAGLGWWVICMVELFRRNPTPRQRQLVAAVALLLGLMLFSVLNLTLALLLAAVPYLASRILPDRSRALIQLLAPTMLIGFACLTSYSHRPWALFVGALVAVVIEAWAWRAGRSPTLVALVIGCLFISGSLLFFGQDIIYWYFVKNFVPVARALRVVSRGLLLALIPASLGLACFFDQPRTRPKQLAAAFALGLLCFLEQGVTTPSTNKAIWRTAARELARHVEPHCTSFYYSPHYPDLELNAYHLHGMWAQLETGIPTINGYSGWTPPGWQPLYYSNANNESDIERLGQALWQWAFDHQMKPSEICWVGGRSDAIVRGNTEADLHQPDGQGPMTP